VDGYEMIDDQMEAASLGIKSYVLAYLYVEEMRTDELFSKQ
jgi:hypothetical protein